MLTIVYGIPFLGALALLLICMYFMGKPKKKSEVEQKLEKAKKDHDLAQKIKENAADIKEDKKTINEFMDK